LNAKIQKVERRFATSILHFRIKPNRRIQKSEKYAIGGLFMGIENGGKSCFKFKN